ncbi:ATP-dependent helicase [Telmatocola sphagniphila]|uniref:ATP-dependent helicase n=1 Tax=Telmatocola sphagniphila TaxID=1123043 RepID=A0A8E6B4E0_9BACT|nr:UvrD-helicase domain-containing protein [Telmatocola sphagniphila]QVL30318.1 ATP-dependent helicase [Telmatocola sphagniphila]
MRFPTVEQQAVIDNKNGSRIRVVRASPGSGKTWMVAELILRELNSWQTQTSGIAALSFTKVGGEEIRKAVGRDLSHPHFVGTIDSFLFRYVIRPFFCKCYPIFRHPRLLPGEWGAEHWSSLGKGLKANVGKGINLCSCVWIDEDCQGAIAARKPHPMQPLIKLTGDDLRIVKECKNNVWKKSGLMTHSDAALWASKLLEDEKYKALIITEITRRFPLIFIDELQDTGFFLSKCLKSILSSSYVRGVLVGDPDQSIFEFNGARPDLFDQFEIIQDAEVFPLSTSLRCSKSVAKVASHLKETGNIVSPENNPVGRALMVTYDDMVVDFNRLSAAVSKSHSNSVIKAIARLNMTVRVLKGHKSEQPRKLGSPPLNHFQRAVIAFRQGQNSLALAACRASLELALFEQEGITDEQLSKYGLSVFEWRERCVQCLLEGDSLDVNDTLFGWQSKAWTIITRHISAVAAIKGLAGKSHLKLKEFSNN